MKRIIVGVSGASGTPLALAVLKLLARFPEVESHLVMSRGAEETMRFECGEAAAGGLWDTLAVRHAIDDLAAPISSGSFDADGMIVVPCSMKTLAGIACGFSENLLLRAADVTVKEGRPLVLAVRESPLSAIHLENMLKLSRIPNVRIMPPVLSYYQGVKTIGELEIQLAARWLRAFGLRAGEFRPWAGSRPGA